MHSSSDDAKKQKEQENAELDAMAKDTELRQKEGEGAGEDDARGLRNQFNFSERASQTLNNGLPRHHPALTATSLALPRPRPPPPPPPPLSPSPSPLTTQGCASAAR
jgi:hypothetical protein